MKRAQINVREEVRKDRAFDEFAARLAALRASLPPRLMRAASYAIDNPEEVAFGTTAEIAAKAGVQPSTLVRLGQHFGFSGFSDMQEVFRAEIRKGWRLWRSAQGL